MSALLYIIINVLQGSAFLMLEGTGQGSGVVEQRLGSFLYHAGDDGMFQV